MSRTQRPLCDRYSAVHLFIQLYNDLVHLFFDGSAQLRQKFSSSHLPVHMLNPMTRDMARSQYVIKSLHDLGYHEVTYLRNFCEVKEESQEFLEVFGRMNEWGGRYLLITVHLLEGG